MIVPAQIPNPYVKPRWQAPVGVMESVVAYNCREYGFPRPVLAMPMWEGAGKRVLDYSGRGNHGIFSGTPEWKEDTIRIERNTTDVISLSSEISIGPIGTIFFRYYTTNSLAYSYQMFLGKNYERNNRVSLNQPTPAYHLRDAGSNNKYFPLPSAEPLDTPLSMCLTVDGIHWRLYTGGICLTPQVYSAYLVLDSFGNAYDSLNYTLGGGIYCCCVFDTTLSASQAKFITDNPYFMYQIPEELYGYSPAAVGAIMNQFQKANIGADLYNGAIIA